MTRVFSGKTLPEVGHLRNLLEQAGIACLIKNEQLAGGLGDIPFIECMPELWVLEDAEAPLARTIIAESMLGEGPPLGAAAAAWRCRGCGEPNEGQFAACWNCGTRDASV